MLNTFQRRVDKNSLTWWYVLKTSWRYLCKTSWRSLEDVFQDVLKTSWKHLEYVLKTYGQDEYIGFDQDVLKASSEVTRLRRTYLSWSRRLEDIFKTSSEDEDKRRFQDVLKTSLSRRMFAGMLPIYWVNVLVMCKSLDIFFFVLFFFIFSDNNFFCHIDWEKSWDSFCKSEWRVKIYEIFIVFFDYRNP